MKCFSIVQIFDQGHRRVFQDKLRLQGYEWNLADTWVEQICGTVQFLVKSVILGHESICVCSSTWFLKHSQNTSIARKGICLGFINSPVLNIFVQNVSRKPTFSQVFIWFSGVGYHNEITSSCFKNSVMYSTHPWRGSCFLRTLHEALCTYVIKT